MVTRIDAIPGGLPARPMDRTLRVLPLTLLADMGTLARDVPPEPHLADGPSPPLGHLNDFNHRDAHA